MRCGVFGLDCGSMKLFHRGDVEPFLAVCGRRRERRWGMKVAKSLKIRVLRQKSPAGADIFTPWRRRLHPRKMPFAPLEKAFVPPENAICTPGGGICTPGKRHLPPWRRRLYPRKTPFAPREEAFSPPGSGEVAPVFGGVWRALFLPGRRRCLCGGGMWARILLAPGGGGFTVAAVNLLSLTLRLMVLPA